MHIRNIPRILAILLKDQTLSQPDRLAFITWASDDYAIHSDTSNIISNTSQHFLYHSPIYPEDISGEKTTIIKPRAFKHEHLQIARSKERAEVFTPAWLCNAQNNLIDSYWFNRTDVFNTMSDNADGSHSWTPTTQPVTFPEGKTWRTYVRSRRLEMACGEAPYIVSRYDATTGQAIPIDMRIGIIDRKFRIINENIPSIPSTRTHRQWLRYAYIALQSVYGFDFQGDNVFLTRESLLLSFCEYYQSKWGHRPHLAAIAKAAEIISWNIWQMDGINYTVPSNGQDAIIMEWHGTEPLKGKTISFKELIR